MTLEMMLWLKYSTPIYTYILDGVTKPLVAGKGED